ncbi:hypothetical protein BLNAU_10159 [Blattamonas nauphoetae]|uniref:Uncharacterized protein n=1 Tax=Blattamonas nauphoetae TaxID=2049346 RepID=A0ABQ9XTN2_9EUKA|nr:hypothetical protein BLNAU_10159 [Blattamonas nauphoetae]
MISSDDYSPFMKWNENDMFTVDSEAEVLISLLAMIRDGYKFDETLLRQASKCLSWIFQLSDLPSVVDGVLFQIIGQSATDPIPDFVELMTVLLSSSDPSIFRDTMTFFCSLFNHCPLSHQLALVSSRLLPRILSTPNLRNLSVIDDQGILNSVIDIFRFGVWLSSEHKIQSLSTTSHTDPQSIRDVVLNEVLIPIEPSLVQISRNPLFVSSIYIYQETVKLLSKIFDVSAFHQPTLDLVSSSRLPMVFLSLLSNMEDESIRMFILRQLTVYIYTWKKNGDETVRRGKRTLQMLEKEGFGDELELTLLHTESTTYGHKVRIHSFTSLTFLGINCHLFSSHHHFPNV